MAFQETIVLHPTVDPRDLGPEHVDVHLFPAGAPGNGHGHAQMATLPMGSSEGIHPLHLKHPTGEGKQLCVGPGLIVVNSVPRSTLTLFGMGGSATVATCPDHSTVSILSPAPMLLLGKSIYDDELDPIDLFVGELESWLSILRARAHGNVVGFERALLLIPPFTLYAQGLILAARRLGEVPVDERSDLYWRSYTAINAALNAARARPAFPNPLPNFETLLAV